MTMLIAVSGIALGLVATAMSIVVFLKRDLSGTPKAILGVLLGAVGLVFLVVGGASYMFLDGYSRCAQTQVKC